MVTGSGRSVRPKSRQREREDDDEAPTERKPSGLSASSDDKHVLKVTITIGEREFTEDLNEHTAIETDYESLNENLAGHANRLAYWAMLTVKAENAVRKLKRKLDRLMADRYVFWEKAIQESSKTGDKKPTVKAIEAAVETDPKVQTLEDRLDDAESAAATLAVGRASMYAKKDALMELARNMRAAMDSDLEVKQRVPGGGAARKAKKLAKGLKRQFEDEE